jgi:hypothetical protein
MSGQILSAGWKWSPKLVGWGRPGPTPTKEILGYWPAKLDDSKGKLTGDQRIRQTLNIWSMPALYALYQGRQLIYVGQGNPLGDRLLSHYRVDHLVGRWDSFSWVSPQDITTAGGQGGSPKKLELKAPAATLGRITINEFLSEFEAFAIFFGDPVDNRQKPNFGNHTWWLEQVRSRHAEKTSEEMIAEIHVKLASSK